MYLRKNDLMILLHEDAEVEEDEPEDDDDDDDDGFLVLIVCPYLFVEFVSIFFRL